MLSESDAKVLRAISAGESDPQTIAEKTGMKVEAVRASADGLAEQGLILVDKSVEETFSLSLEGESYARDGLPERRLLQFIGAGKPMSDLTDPSSKIGLGWLRKKGWASIDKGMIKPAGDAALGEDEKVLKSLAISPRSGSSLDGKALAALKSRGLLTSSTSKSWRYQATESGRKAATSLEDLDVETIASITSEMITGGQWEGDLVRLAGKLYRPRPYDVSLSSDKIYPGKRHPYQHLIGRMREIMLEMGFTEIRGEIIQSSFWNFDALFQPQDHPAREMQDTFYLETRADIPEFMKVKEMHECGGSVGSTGWGGCWSPEVARQEVLRTHTTAVTIKYLADHPEPPVKAFGIDRVYRREAIDATHTPEFEQLEGVVMDKGVTFSNLLGILKEFYAKMGFEEVRFRPGYFPYTEPSVEPEVWIDGLGWVELGGAGVFRKEVTAPFGIDHPVLAWGLGVGRLAMLNLGLKDLRLLYQSDIQWLRETPITTKV
jgi:phenylalanyl-tRNA synthetase alpha chain